MNEHVVVDNGTVNDQGAPVNGTAKHHAAGPHADGCKEQTPPPQNGSAASPQVARAEEIVDRLAERVAHYTSVWGRGLWRIGARVREEAEDVWGEAQSIRRGDQH